MRGHLYPPHDVASAPASWIILSDRRGTHCAVDAMDYYEELGINRAATDIDINKA